MKLNYRWLKEYVDVKEPPEEVARKLSLSGSAVEAISGAGDDKVLELEITANRPDCLNVLGLAREVSAVYDRELRFPLPGIPAGCDEEKGPKVECVIKSRDLCPRYTARVITHVKVKRVTEKIKKYILSIGLREVNNIADITNFCLMELGQPLHAFDLDKIRGGKIVIREALKGEKIVTIDGEERTLGPGTLVIADSERPIAIAGVMGGKDTEVTGETTNVLLESAYFDPLSVRRTARALGLSSESSYRFERGVDKGMVKEASDRAAALIAEETGGKICQFYDAGDLPAGTREIKFNAGKAGRILGVPLRKEMAKNIFERLGMAVIEENGEELLVEAPTFREDLQREIDLVEEVARIYGYENIPDEITRYVPQITRKEHPRKVLEKAKETLAALGLKEIMTYSLVNDEAIERFATIARHPIELANPVSEEHRIMAPHLLDGMLRSISWNINRSNRDLGFFEIGKTYSRAGWPGKYVETPTVCIGMTGALRNNWGEGRREAGMFDLKGSLETFLERFGLGVSFERKEIDELIGAATVILRGEKEGEGFIGEVSGKILGRYGVEQPVYVCHLKLDRMIEKSSLVNHYHAISRFPSSTRDVSVLCDRALAAGDVMKVIIKTGEEIVRSAELIDVYQGEQIGAGQKSLTYSIEYGLDTRTLKDEEIEAVHSKVKDELAKKLKVSFR